MNTRVWFQFLKTIFTLTLFGLILTSSTLPVQADVSPNYSLLFTTLQFESTDINSVAVYEAGNKVFIGDAANDAIIVLNATTDEVITTITGVPGGGGGGLVVNETYGKVYFYTNTNTGVLDAINNQLLSLSLPEGALIHDEINDKLYIMDANASNYSIWVLDIATDNSSFLYSGSGNAYAAKINPTTNELAVLIFFPARIDFINVNTLAVNSFDITAAGGDHALRLEVNTLENKYYATLITMPGQGQMGIFILDRDTNIPAFVGQDDLEPLVYNPSSNTLFSGVQVGTSMGWIDGATDSFTSIETGTNWHSGHGDGAVRYSTDHAYFVSSTELIFVDHATETVQYFNLPVPQGTGGGGGQQIAINQSTGRIYIIADGQAGKVFVTQDLPSQGVGNLFQDGGFESGVLNPYWMAYSQFGYEYPPLCDINLCGIGAHSGSVWATLGWLGSENEISQTGVIPTNVNSLSFWLRIPYRGDFGSSDSVRVEIDGDVIFSVSGDHIATYGTYKKVTLNISAYADGGVHNIRFYSLVYPSGDQTATIFDIDDVALEAAPINVSFRSVAAQDGWILEKTETSNKGGSINANAATFQLGDDALNRQYKAILSFNTSALPDNAIIQSAVLKIKQSGAPVGGNPFNILGKLWVDIRQGPFGTPALQAADFRSPASAAKVSAFNKTPTGGWYTSTLNAAGLSKINKTGLTQLRLYFAKDDNNNRKANFMKFVSGNGSASLRPLLIITYTAPPTP